MAVAPDPSQPFLVIGHRGSPRVAPENSVASLQAAFAAGADAIETDLRRLSDGAIVLHHNDMAGGRPVEELTTEELRLLVPTTATLDDALTALPGRLMVLEIKRGGWEEELRSAIEPLAGHLIVSSFDHRVLRNLPPTIARGVLVAGYQLGAAEYAARLGARWLFPPAAMVDADLVGTCHREGISVIPWTSDSPDEWEAFRALHCDGVITNTPGPAARWRDRALC